MKYYLFSDGGSRSNPGPAGCGFVFYPHNLIISDFDFSNLPQGLVCGCAYLGQQTNNFAEYAGLIWGLKNALEHGIKDLQVFVDSNLVASQMNGQFKVKSANIKPLFASAKELSLKFDFFKIEHVYRDGNKIADRLANIAMDDCQNSGNFLIDFDRQLLGLPATQDKLF
ncbi:MAG: ribonuclease HI family protein [Coriobacteriales bacterium]|nr:ribonuclease HI family protein [Coriobacteriales bacterium]